MSYKGVIFDFNGTLFWDTDMHNRAWDKFFDKYQIKMTDAEKFQKMHGKNNRDILNSLFNEHLSDKEIEDLALEKELMYQELCLKTEMKLAPGVEEFLSFLKEKDIPYTIATASGIENVDFYFKHLALSDWFDRKKVVYNNGKIKSKPDPEIYQTAMSVIKRKAEDTIVFEDAIAGLEAARNAKSGKIIVVDSYNDDYSGWEQYQRIHHYKEVDRQLFL